MAEDIPCLLLYPFLVALVQLQWPLSTLKSHQLHSYLKAFEPVTEYQNSLPLQHVQFRSLFSCGPLKNRLWWGSEHAAPKYGTLAYWIFETEGIWKTTVTWRLSYIFLPPESGQLIMWEVPSLYPKEKSIFISKN